MESDDNVLAFEPEVLVFERRREGGRRCHHYRVAIDAVARAVWCRDCDRHLDPIDVLSRYAADHYRLRDKMKAHRPEQWEGIESFIQEGGRLTIGGKGGTVAKLDGLSRKGNATTLAGLVVNAIAEVRRAARWKAGKG